MFSATHSHRAREVSLINVWPENTITPFFFFYSHRHYVYVVFQWCQNVKKIRNCCFSNISCDMDLENHLSICNFFLTLVYFGLASLAKLVHIFNNPPSQHTCRLCVCVHAGNQGQGLVFPRQILYNWGKIPSLYVVYNSWIVLRESRTFF